MALVLPRLSLALLAAAAAAQLPAPPIYPMPPEVLASLDLRTGNIQELLLPQRGRTAFEVRVTIDGAVHTLQLRPDSNRAENFQLLVTGPNGTLPVQPPEETTYSGTVAGVAGTAVAASLFEGQLEAHIRMPSGVWSIQPLTTVLPISPRELHAVFKNSDVVANGVSCGVTATADHHHQNTGSVGPAALQYCEIALDCDDAYYARNGSNVANTARAAALLNFAVSAIYQVDVEIRMVLTAILVRTTPIYTTGPDLGCGGNGLLQEFRTYWINNHGNIPRDIAHLITGTGSFSGVVGCAFTGVVCTTSGYGASRAISGNNAQNIGLVAHEIGHNWSATHCDSATPCNIMCASLGGCSGVLNTFGPTERSQILAHKATRNCLSSPVPVEPNAEVYYRLNTVFQGPGLSLDVINDGTNNRVIMAPSGNFTGQYWRFEPVAGRPGNYRMFSFWRGPSVALDIINGGADNNQPILAPVGNFTGQLWSLTALPEFAGSVALTTEFRGPNLALEGAGGSTANRPVLATFGPFSGQAWNLVPEFSVNPAATTAFGTGCRGRGGVPTLQGTAGALPWVGENFSGEITNAPAGTVGVLIIGGLQATPIDLAILQSPGCLLRVNLDVTFVVPVSGGRAAFTLPVPNNIPLVGGRLPMQGAIVDPAHITSDPLVAMSNGLELRFGLR